MTDSTKNSLTITLCAQPDPDYAPSSHRGSVLIRPREFAVSTLARAVETFSVFVMDNNLSPVNLVGAGLVRRDGQPLCRVSINGKLSAVDETGRETGQQYVRPRFSDVGQIVRFLRQAADLTRNEMADATGIAASTIRNLETRRQTASAWTWRQILGHESMRDFPRLAAEAGLKPPIT